jgi:hypothetical protein
MAMSVQWNKAAHLMTAKQQREGRRGKDPNDPFKKMHEVFLKVLFHPNSTTGYLLPRLELTAIGEHLRSKP